MLYIYIYIYCESLIEGTHLFSKIVQHASYISYYNIYFTKICVTVGFYYYFVLIFTMSIYFSIMQLLYTFSNSVHIPYNYCEYKVIKNNVQCSAIGLIALFLVCFISIMLFCVIATSIIHGNLTLPPLFTVRRIKHYPQTSYTRSCCNLFVYIPATLLV